MGHGSGIPSTGLRKACLLSVVVTKTAFFGRFLRFLRFPFFFPSFPFFCSESERFCVIFPLFVHNPSGFGFFSPFSFTIRALFVVRRPQSPPKPPTECPVTRDLPQRAPRRMRQPRRRKARPVSARLGGERGLGEPGSTAPRLRATATRPPGGTSLHWWNYMPYNRASAYSEKHIVPLYARVGI